MSEVFANAIIHQARQVNVLCPVWWRNQCYQEMRNLLFRKRSVSSFTCQVQFSMVTKQQNAKNGKWKWTSQSLTEFRLVAKVKYT